MAAAVVAASNSHRPAIARPGSPFVPLPCSASRVRVNPACVASPAEVRKEADDKQAARRQRYRPRDEEKPRPSSSPVRRRRRDGDEVSPERKRRRGSDSYHRDVRRGSSSSPSRSASSATTGYRRDRDDAYRAARKHESDRDREDVTRKSVSGTSRPEQRARTTSRSSATPTQQHQLAAAVDDSNRKATPEKVEKAQDEAEIKRRMDIQRQREEARRVMEEMVKTVEFNDPFISPLDVLKPLLGTEAWTKEWRRDCPGPRAFM